jgi:hypothetical protein
MAKGKVSNRGNVVVSGRVKVKANGIAFMSSGKGKSQSSSVMHL